MISQWLYFKNEQKINKTKQNIHLSGNFSVARKCCQNCTQLIDLSESNFAFLQTVPKVGTQHGRWQLPNGVKGMCATT